MRTQLLSLIGLALSAASCTVVEPTPVAVAPATTTASATPSGQYCREYTATAVVGDSQQETVGIACLQPDGRWKIVDGDRAPIDQAPAPQVAAAAPPPAVAYPAYPYYYYPYYYPYPAYWGPSVGIGLGFRFGGGHHHH